MVCAYLSACSVHILYCRSSVFAPEHRVSEAASNESDDQAVGLSENLQVPCFSQQRDGDTSSESGDANQRNDQIKTCTELQGVSTKF